MSASVIPASIMVDMQFENPPALFDRLEVQAESEYLLPFVEREADIGLSVHLLETDLVAVDRQIGFRHRVDGIPLRMQAEFTQQIQLFGFTDGNLPDPGSRFLPFGSGLIAGNLRTGSKRQQRDSGAIAEMFHYFHLHDHYELR